MNQIDTLTRLIMQGLPSDDEKKLAEKETETAIDGLFGERYHATSKYSKRVSWMTKEDSASFAGLLHPDSPSSGVYGGLSLIWFPVQATDESPASSLLTLVCGTRGLAPDENILGRPGHARHLKALQRLLRKHGLDSWVKPVPADLSEPMPNLIKEKYSKFGTALSRYGNHIYFCVEVPTDDFERAKRAVSSLLDFYAQERRWKASKTYAAEIADLQQTLRAQLFPRVGASEVLNLLKQRRFVILQGPPGTGKTRMAQEILKNDFGGNGLSFQFHPAVTYESFVAGIAPRVEESGTLNFEVKRGCLVQAIEESKHKTFLLTIDEINRADLSRVLGEALYLFEPREINEGEQREVSLPTPLSKNETTISIPKNLFVLGTMNSADRSIAIMDMAVRRRFAFVDVWPDAEVIAAQGLDVAIDAYGKLQDIFAQYASDDSFALLPGHSYFLAKDRAEFVTRMKFELLPLLNEYLLEGRLSGFETELRAYMDWLSGEIES